MLRAYAVKMSSTDAFAPSAESKIAWSDEVPDAEISAPIGSAAATQLLKAKAAGCRLLINDKTYRIVSLGETSESNIFYLAHLR